MQNSINRDRPLMITDLNISHETDGRTRYIASSMITLLRRLQRDKNQAQTICISSVMTSL